MDWAHSARFKTHTFEQSLLDLLPGCRPHPTTAALRCPSATCWSEPNAPGISVPLEDGVLSLALPVQGLDPCISWWIWRRTTLPFSVGQRTGPLPRRQQDAVITWNCPAPNASNWRNASVM